VSVELLTLLFFGSLLVFLFIGTPLTFTLGGISVVFLYFTMGPVGFYIVASKFWDSMMSFTLIAIPMYVYMAMLLEKSGVANDLYRMMHLCHFSVLRYRNAATAHPVRANSAPYNSRLWSENAKQSCSSPDFGQRS